MTSSATVIEIFPSIQGEGALIGTPQLFIRLHGCSLTCNYCDTPATHRPVEACRIYPHPFSPAQADDAILEQNPISANQLTGIIETHFPHYRFFSITGGEPLEQAGFLEQWLPKFKQEHARKILLETAGVHVEALKRVLPWIDVVSVDIKLKSATGMTRNFFDLHRRFLTVLLSCAQTCRTYVKIVLDENVHASEKEALAGFMRDFPHVAYYLQPTTPITAAALRLAVTWAEEWSAQGIEVRCLPQLHPLLNLR